MITSLAFILYPVTDLAAARRFYEESLGLRLTHSFADQWFEYDLGDTTFAIAAADAEHPVPTRGAVVAFEVDDLQAEVARLKGLGIAPTRDVAETPVCQLASVRDPDGNAILLHQRRKRP
jgi:catechol 2,3-dioxygenase-like lactoylglutathione lyase family enzyme